MEIQVSDELYNSFTVLEFLNHIIDFTIVLYLCYRIL